MNLVKTTFGTLKNGDRFYLLLGDKLREYEKIPQPPTRNRYNMRNVETENLGRIGDKTIVKIRKP